MPVSASGSIASTEDRMRVSISKPGAALSGAPSSRRLFCPECRRKPRHGKARERKAPISMQEVSAAGPEIFMGQARRGTRTRPAADVRRPSGESGRRRTARRRQPLELQACCGPVHCRPRRHRRIRGLRAPWRPPAVRRATRRWQCRRCSACARANSGSDCRRAVPDHGSCR